MEGVKTKDDLTNYSNHITMIFPHKFVIAISTNIQIMVRSKKYYVS
jgi:hypothetical protein